VTVPLEGLHIITDENSVVWLIHRKIAAILDGRRVFARRGTIDDEVVVVGPPSAIEIATVDAGDLLAFKGDWGLSCSG
jgi:hypothetical protein